jgi:serine/threonine-protein kinase RsbT
MVERMIIQREQSFPIQVAEHVVGARQKVREWAVALGFSLVEQTKLVTAASELARNTLTHGGGGVMRLEVVSNSIRQGLRLTFEDNGPGIPHIELALQDGYTTGAGLGMGLSGSRRLVNEFEIHSQVGEGTRVTVVKWK